MSKRKVAEEAKAAVTKAQDSDEDMGDEDMDTVNVDFDWFDLDPEVDFLGLKTLLRQTLEVDHESINLSALADQILIPDRVGSTIKCDGKESDPFAYITVLDLNKHKDAAVVSELRQYLLDRLQSVPAKEQFIAVLGTESKFRPGLIMTERFINMPPQIVPPLYTMLSDEVQAKVDKGEMEPFTHYIIWSKTYNEVTSDLDAEDDRPRKKNKGAKAPETFLFHAEDEILHKHAVAHTDFEYLRHDQQETSDAKRTFQDFGIISKGHLILLEAAKLKPAIEAVKTYIEDA